jgi:hypothetical protein
MCFKFWVSGFKLSLETQNTFLKTVKILRGVFLPYLTYFCLLKSVNHGYTY